MEGKRAYLVLEDRDERRLTLRWLRNERKKAGEMGGEGNGDGFGPLEVPPWVTDGGNSILPELALGGAGGGIVFCSGLALQPKRSLTAENNPPGPLCFFTAGE